MVIGNRLNLENIWKLGKDRIDEVDEFKYLVCYVNGSLKSNFNVNCYLKERVKNQLNYLTRILGEHGDLNRIHLGEALCISVISPSLTHGCAIWISLSSTNKEALESMQYHAAKIVLRTNIYLFVFL